MWRDSRLERRIELQLARWRDQGLRRTLRSPSGVDLSSNDYLGLARDPRLVEALHAAAMREGVGSTGSRLLRGQRDAFDAVEQRFARFKHTERSLYFSSGYLANVAVLSSLTEAGDTIFSDALNHASLVDGIRLSRARRVVFPHNDMAALTKALDEEPCDGVRFVVVESLYSMEGDEAPLAALAALCRDIEAVLIVDEAHAVGVYGERGSGLIEREGIDEAVCVSINAAGKALGVAGAFVAAPASVIDFLTQRARPFVFSTAPPPALAAVIDRSLDLLRDEPERRVGLLARAALLRRALGIRGVATGPGASQIVSIPIGENASAVRVADLLRDDGFDVRAIRPPTVPPHTARLRVSVNVGLSEAVLARFAEAAAAALERAGVCSEVSS